MVEINSVYKCEVCGNIVEVANVGGGTLVCCGQPMTEMKENTVDAAKEKHVPVIEVVGKQTVIRVGEVEHPMEDAHYIQWIELIANDKVLRKYLKPGQKPEATFDVAPEKLTARAYCNLHGLWSKEK